MPDDQEEGTTLTRDGSSPDVAVVVGSVREEREWIRDNYPDSAVVLQQLIDIGGRQFDALTVRSESGAEWEVYFDISAFFGKQKQPGPPCPYCGASLRTQNARQCRHCGADWHDPTNVVHRRT